MRRRLGIGFTVLLAAAACSKPPPDPAAGAMIPTYDKTTGKLSQLAYDRNRNGVMDTWTDMDGARPLGSRIDQNEDGKPDRWEYYDDQGKLLKVGFSRSNDTKPDSWSFPDPGGTIARVEISSKSDEKAIDRWEFYTGNQLVRVEQDTNGDGRADMWETFEGAVLKTASYDEDADGKPDRRLTYNDGQLALIESAPDGAGRYTKRTVPQ
jgi:hypothetical protein